MFNNMTPVELEARLYASDAPTPEWLHKALADSIDLEDAEDQLCESQNEQVALEDRIDRLTAALADCVEDLRLLRGAIEDGDLDGAEAIINEHWFDAHISEAELYF